MTSSDPKLCVAYNMLYGRILYIILYILHIQIQTEEQRILLRI
jgi:hypothetical protein